MIHERSLGSRLFDIANVVFLGFLGLLCVFPLVNLVAISLSGRAAVQGNLVTFWPIGFNVANYTQIMSDSQFLRSFEISLARVVVGTTINMLLIVFTAYPLSLDLGFRGQHFFKWLLVGAMLFDGGLIPRYLVIRDLGLLNSLWALVLPPAVQVFFIIVMLNFFRSLPKELAEAATVDGASHWRILFNIYLPLSVPGLLTLGLFCAVFHWNSWFDGLIYMNSAKNYPLQSYLQTFLTGRDMGSFQANPQQMANLSDQALHAAQIVIAIIPILIVYPFLQRYFVTGLTLGSVKE